MNYDQFLRSLFEDGRVRLPDTRLISDDDLMAGREPIVTFERHYRMEIPGEPPGLVIDAAEWAARNFFWACQAAVFRELGEDAIRSELSTLCPRSINAAAHYSVDLVFRFLPDLTKFAASAAENDPLVKYLQQWARDWPLSSVGLANVEPIDISGFANHASLISLYADRIIVRGDQSRLSDQRARRAVEAAVGKFPELAPKLSEALKTPAKDEETE